MASLSTHVLDIARGAPAPGIDVALWHIGHHPREVGRGVTDVERALVGAWIAQGAKT